MAITETEASGDCEQAGTCQEALLLCHSPHKEAKERQILKRRSEKFEAAIEQLAAGMTKPRTSKKYGKIMERIGRLKEKYYVGDYFDIQVSGRDGIVYGISCEILPLSKALSAP